MAATSPVAPRKRQISSPSSATFTGLREPTVRSVDGRIPVVAQAELGDEVADVAAELRDRRCRCASATCSGTWSRVVGTPISSACEHREALVGVERPRLDEVALVGLAPQRLHGAGQHVPVEHLLLARRLDGGERASAPGLVVADAERLVEPPVGLDVGIELVVLVGQERVRPARRGDERDAPRALAHGPRGRGARPPCSASATATADRGRRRRAGWRGCRGRRAGRSRAGRSS